MATGGCICGNIRYEYTGEPAMKAICHCLTCRHLTGSTFSTNLVIPENSFKYTAGQPRKYTVKQDSGMLLTYNFCDKCGSLLTKTADAEAFDGVILVAAGSLDEASGIENAEPGVEFYTSRRVSWLPTLEGKAQALEFVPQ